MSSSWLVLKKYCDAESASVAPGVEKGRHRADTRLTALEGGALRTSYGGVVRPRVDFGEGEGRVISCVVRIRTITAADQPLVRNWLREHGPTLPGDQICALSSVMLGFVESDLIGIAAFQRNELHPTILVEHLCVHRAHRRRGVATRLHRLLLSTFPPRDEDTALDVACRPDDFAAVSFVKKMGFQRFVEGNLLIVDSTRMVPVQSGDSMIGLGADASFDLRGAARAFFIRRYTEEHDKDLPVTHNEDTWSRMYREGDVAVGVTLVDGEVVVGCAFAYPDLVEAGQVLLNGYATGRDVDEEVRRLMALYGFQCRLLAQHGHRTVFLEVDSTERIAEQMLQRLPIVQRTVIERYHRKL